MRHLMTSACMLAAVFCAQSAYGYSEDAVTYSWTGLYAGINGGYGWGTSSWNLTGSSASYDNSGGIVGLQAGYDAQIGSNLVAGLEASIDASDVGGKGSCMGGKSCETDGASFGDVSARVGAVYGQALVYVKGGIAYEAPMHHVESLGIDNHDNGDGVPGYLLGAGTEVALTHNITTSLEYNYMNFGSNNYTAGSAGRITVNEPLNIVKIGLNFKFE